MRSLPLLVAASVCSFALAACAVATLPDFGDPERDAEAADAHPPATDAQTNDVALLPSDDAGPDVADASSKPDGKPQMGTADGGTPCTSNAGCKSNQFCDQDYACQGVGTCALIPKTCPPTLELVCGCDGKSYSRPCDAHMAGVSVANTGGCTL